MPRGNGLGPIGAGAGGGRGKGGLSEALDRGPAEWEWGVAAWVVWD
jgi:hypothetical protein